jgi:hypothetical protein
VALLGMALIGPGCDDADHDHHNGDMHGEKNGDTHGRHEEMHDGSGGDTVSVVNARCPIMGNRIDPNSVPKELTVEWQGKTVGFCCAACPPQWKDLSDEEKQQKLTRATTDSQE